MVCNNCDSEDCSPLLRVKCFFTGEPLSVVKCKNCDLVYLDPRPDKNVGLAYFENAYSHAADFETHAYYRDHEQIFKRNEARFLQIEKLDLPNKHVLDFGAGQGHFVKVARERGWSSVGIELSTAGISAAEKNFGIELLHSVDHLKIRDFGIIALWDVIEHLEDPRGTLEQLSQFLHREGYFIIETSNIDSADYILLNDQWSYWHVDHLYYFSRKTLNDLLNNLNFEVVDSPTSATRTQPKNLHASDYFKLLNPVALHAVLKKRTIMSKNKGLAKSSLMTLVARRRRKAAD